MYFYYSFISQKKKKKRILGLTGYSRVKAQGLLNKHEYNH